MFSGWPLLVRNVVAARWRRHSFGFPKFQKAASSSLFLKPIPFERWISFFRRI
jgi:hypothetical protein